MYMDAIGVRDSLLDLAQRISDQGFVVLVPNLFYRDHAAPFYNYPEKFDRAELSENLFPTVSPWMSKLQPELLLRDAEKYLNHILGHPKVKGHKVGIVGYCFGGGHAVRTAATYPERVQSVVSLHGGKLCTDDERSPHIYLKEVKAQLYFGHADHDQSMPLPAIQKLDAELKFQGNNYFSEIYSGAHHGFTQKDLPSYAEEASEKSFEKTMNLFRKLK